MRFTEKDDFLGYTIPQTNAVGDKQINIALLGKSDNLDEASVTVICQNYIVGEPIRQFGRIEDVLGKHDVESAEELDLILEGLAKVYQENADLKNELAELKEKLAQYENIEKEIGCDIEVFWKVYRRLSGHGKSDIHLYSIFNNEIVEIMPTEIMSGTYSNYPQDCSFKYLVWDKICESYQETYSYFHFHDYNNEWFLSKEEAEKKLAETKGEKNE